MSIASSFDDGELTALAMDIIKDLNLNTKPKYTPTDSFISKLAHEIEEELTSDMDRCPSFYTDPSLCPPSPSSTKYDQVIQLQPLTPLSPICPIIIAHHQLSSCDSFNYPLPPIPSPSTNYKYDKYGRFTVPSTRIAKHMPKIHESKSYSPKPRRFQSRFHPPPQSSPEISVFAASDSKTSDFSTPNASPTDSDPSSGLSRRHSAKPKVCAIPDFSGFTDVEINLKTKQSDKRNGRKRRKHSNKDKKRKNDRQNMRNSKHNSQKRSRSANSKRSKMRRRSANSNAQIQRRGHKTRARSVILRSPKDSETELYNEYAVEVDGVFLFVKAV